MNKANLITVRVKAKTRKQVEALAEKENRTISNMADYLILLGLLKYAERDLK